MRACERKGIGTSDVVALQMLQFSWYLPQTFFYSEHSFYAAPRRIRTRTTFYINCSRRHQIPCFKVRTKSYGASTRTAEPRRVNTALNSQCSKATNAVLTITALQCGGLKSFCGLEACNLVKATIAKPCTLHLGCS